MYLFSKVRDISAYTNDFHFFYTPIDCRSKRDFLRFIGSTILLALMTISPRKIVYYSSGAVTAEHSWYAFFKKLHERMLRKSDLILRIPHVYSSDRDKGLIQVLREGTFIGDKEIELEYITDLDFRDYFYRNIEKDGVVEYDGDYHRDTVEDIEIKFLGKNG